MLAAAAASKAQDGLQGMQNGLREFRAAVKIGDWKTAEEARLRTISGIEDFFDHSLILANLEAGNGQGK